MTDDQDAPPVTRNQAGTASTTLPSRLDGLAVFLDVDGTLLDIAPTPDGVTIPEGLSRDLARFATAVDGALALVSGRRIAFLRDRFPGLRCAAAGLHGVEIDLADGTYAAVQRSPEVESSVARLRRAAAGWDGVVVEDKGLAFAGHFRLAPAHADAVEREMTEIARHLGSDYAIQKGKNVIEIRPAGHDKGTALETFMRHPPFAGRRPLAIGDDLTDEHMFAAVNRLGGLSAKVGMSGATVAGMRVAEPADVRAWIRDAAR